MAHYTARVQLPGNPTFEQYGRLHAAMLALGLYVITDQIGGGHYALPHGFYAGRSNLEISALAMAAKTRADQIVPGAEVVVTEGNMSFVGLKFLPVNAIANSR